MIRGDRQGLFYGKFDAPRYRTHLLKLRVQLFTESTAQADFIFLGSFIMDISQIDPNFKDSTIPEGADIVWHDLLNPAFSLHGVKYDKDLGFLRMAERIKPVLEEMLENK